MLSLSLRSRQVISCDCCAGHMEDHEEGCPREQMQAIVLNGPDCPVCYKGKLLPNVHDFLECRYCSNQFTRSQIAAGYDPETLVQFTVIDYDANEHFAVLQIPDKGTGNFQYLIVVCNLQASIKHRQKMKIDILIQQARDEGKTSYQLWRLKHELVKSLTYQAERGTPA